MELKRKPRFSFTGCVLLCALILSTSIVNAEELGPYLGHYKGKGETTEYTLMFPFGIEQWENDKKSTYRYQQWLFMISYPDILTKKWTIGITLERTIFDGVDNKFGIGAVASSRTHSQADGTLQLRGVDPKRGIVDFTIVFDDTSTAEVMLRMKFKDGSVYLDSFKAVGIARGVLSDTMTPIEYRIPKYTYTLNVPIKMHGLREEGAKEWDDMLSTLSKEDQIAWEKFRFEMPTKCKTLNKTFADEETLKKIMPDYEKRKPELDKGGPFTPEERNKLEAIFVEEWAKCISKSSISKDGQSKISNEMKRSFNEAFSK
jgi:hypothetical protein